ncbi:MAG: hypothetical protein ABI813_12695 [Bacteroidota bacterium]
MPRITARLVFIILFCLETAATVVAQDTSFYARHAAVLFPYPMYRDKWRAAIGLTLLTTPEAITEETRLRIPCGDFRFLRRINDYFFTDNHIMFQFLQNHLSTGLHVVLPINKNIYFSAGDDIGYWFGYLKISGFNSQASGWFNYPNLSIGYKTKNNLLISFKAQVAINLYYKAANGENKFSSGTSYYNGETFSIALEQPFYNKRHLILSLATINNYFYWQTWSLFYKTDRKVFYPQITVALIL